MPIEFNPLWKLADPTVALILGILLIGIVATTAFFLGWNLTRSKRGSYSRWLAMISELLVSVGIVGLITFAARSKIDADIRRADATAQELRRAINAEFWDYAKVQCLPNAPISSNRIEANTIESACELLPRIITAPNEPVDWWLARDQLADMARMDGISPKTSKTFSSISQRIDALIDAHDEFGRDKYKKKLLESDVSWEMIALFVLLAAIGVGLKWARAALDLFRWPVEENSATTATSILQKASTASIVD